MAVTQRNSNAAMILLFLYRLVEVLKDYFRELEEESIRDNFVITYELMDEMMDFGYPQISEAKILREYITQARRRRRARRCRRPGAAPAAWSTESWQFGELLAHAALTHRAATRVDAFAGGAQA